MSGLLFGYYPATILSYDKNSRTARVSIASVTDGASGGLKATFAYAIGENDKDTEVLINANDEVWVFFEGGQPHAPVIAFYRSHGEGALNDIRRIRQENIELLANTNFSITSTNVEITGTGNWYGNLRVHGEFQASKIKTDAGIDLDEHPHGGVMRGSLETDPPIATPP